MWWYLNINKPRIRTIKCSSTTHPPPLEFSETKFEKETFLVKMKRRLSQWKEALLGEKMEGGL